MPCNLLTIPVELLVQHILAHLDLPTLRLCSSTCKHLNLTIKSSPLLKYLIRLQEMNLIDNPAVSFNNIPLASRLDMLREYGERLGVKWKASAAVLPTQPSYMTQSRLMKGDAGILYVSPQNDRELHWTILPSKSDQTVEWNIIRPSVPSAKIVANALSIEGDDLIALATWCEGPTPGNSSIQIHLIQHSTQLPYPGLVSILDICDFQILYAGDHPVVELGIRGTNLAIVVGHDSLREIMNPHPSTFCGHLSVWNWKTGKKKCEKKGASGKDTSLVLLREDILLCGSSLSLSLDIYHIPSTPSDGDHEPHLIECLGLPSLHQGLHEFNLNISFHDNPTIVPSFAESSNPTVPRLFAADSLSSILTIEMMFERFIGHTSYLFIIHHGALLGRAEGALSRYRRGQDVAVSWEEWGPDATRMFSYNQDSYPFDTQYGSRLFIQNDDLGAIEVFDFGRADGANNQGPEESQTQSALSWSVDQDDGGNYHKWFQDDIHTKLPFVREVIKESSTGDWHTMYVDHSRVVGIQDDERIDVLYFGD